MEQDNLMNKLVHALVAHFDSVFYGPNGDYAAVMEVVGQVTARQALWKPGREQNSIWQIVEHLAACKDWQVSMIETGQMLDMVWPEPSGDENEWKVAKRRLTDAHERLKRTLLQLTDEKLLEIREPKSGQSLLELILSSGSAHEAQHAGQLDYLRGMQIAKA